MVKEFQAVVLAAGKGTRMTELTASKAKCLLPIGNKPMLWYPLQLLERNGIREAIVVVMEQVRSEVQATLDRSGLKIRVEYVGIPGAEDWGTADTLRHLSDRIKTDVLIVSCDLVTDMKLFPVFDMFRKHSAGVVALFFHPSHLESTTPGPKSKQKPERDLVGLDTDTSRLVFLASVSDFDDVVPLSCRLLRKHKKVSMFSQLTDAHLYLLKKWVVDYLQHDRNLSTLKGELIPHIVKKQTSKLNTARRATDVNPGNGDEVKKDLVHFAQEDCLVHKIRELSFYNDHTGDMEPVYHGDIVRCYAYVAPKEQFGVRANTVAAYFNLNTKISSLWPSITGGCEQVRVHPSCEIKSTQMDDVCMVGEGTKVAEKTSIKGCLIGSHCEIESKVRLTNCVIMNNVKIREGCVVSNCVLCDDVEICNNARLSDCLVGSHHTLPANASHANEVLTDDNRLMEI